MRPTAAIRLLPALPRPALPRPALPRLALPKTRNGWLAFGAFADDSENRNDLGPQALRRACAHHGVDFAIERVWVIGDTPHDIVCGQAFGARTLAVATGVAKLAELKKHDADWTVENLTQISAREICSR